MPKRHPIKEYNMSQYVTTGYASTSAFDIINSLWGDTDRLFRDTDRYVRDDIIELSSEYQISIELPGVSKDSIEIEFDKDLLSITAEKKSASSDGKVLQSNRLYGKIRKNYKIGTLVNRDSIKADYADGVLTITLEKHTDSISKKIKIS